jgi:hypothetical protein
MTAIIALLLTIYKNKKEARKTAWPSLVIPLNLHVEKTTKAVASHRTPRNRVRAFFIASSSMRPSRGKQSIGNYSGGNVR